MVCSESHDFAAQRCRAASHRNRTHRGRPLRCVDADAAGDVESGDVLDALLTATSADRLSTQQVLDELMTLILAGHETTANTLRQPLPNRHGPIGCRCHGTGRRRTALTHWHESPARHGSAVAMFTNLSGCGVVLCTALRCSSWRARRRCSRECSRPSSRCLPVLNAMRRDAAWHVASRAGFAHVGRVGAVNGQSL
jgi:hypothetical protein